MSSFDVTSLGEATLRLSVPPGSRFEVSPTFDAAISGTEINVLCGLRSLGQRTAWMSALPDNAFGRRVERTLRSFGVDCGGIAWVPGGRLGNHFVEYGSAPRPTVVQFDRIGSTFYSIETNQVDWDRLLDTKIVHITGITAMISPAAHRIVQELYCRAEKAGVPISFDVNYRRNLGGFEEAHMALSPFLRRPSVLFCSLRDASSVLRLSGSADEILDGLARLTDADAIVMSRGEDDIMAKIDDDIVRRSVIDVQIVDRLGAGDGLAAGFLAGWLDADPVRGLDYGAAMAAIALAQAGEQVITTEREVREVLIKPRGGLER